MRQNAPIYCTTYCNKGHRMSDGKPVEHNCYVLPPAMLRAERAGDYALALALLEVARPLLEMPRGVKEKNND